ncbi:MAG: hypothetical protein ACLFR1_12190 [Spirochaetia bacterium]
MFVPDGQVTAAEHGSTGANSVFSFSDENTEPEGRNWYSALALPMIPLFLLVGGIVIPLIQSAKPRISNKKTSVKSSMLLFICLTAAGILFHNAFFILLLSCLSFSYLYSYFRNRITAFLLPFSALMLGSTANISFHTLVFQFHRESTQRELLYSLPFVLLLAGVTGVLIFRLIQTRQLLYKPERYKLSLFTIPNKRTGTVSLFQESISGIQSFAPAAAAAGLVSAAVLLISNSNFHLAYGNTAQVYTIINWLTGLPAMLPNQLSTFGVFISSWASRFFLYPEVSSSQIIISQFTAALQAGAGSQAGIEAAYHLGSGIASLVMPSSATLLGLLTVFQVPWTQWMKVQLPIQVLLITLSSIGLIILQLLTGLAGSAPQEELGIGSASASGPVYYIDEDQSLWFSLELEEGENYRCSVSDAYNAEQYDFMPNTGPLLRSLWFQVYMSDAQTPYPDDIYTRADSEGGTSPEGDIPAAQFTAIEASAYILVEGYRRTYSGLFGLTVQGRDEYVQIELEGREERDRETGRSAPEAGNISPPESSEFTEYSLSQGEDVRLSFSVQPDTPYRLFIADSYSNSSFNLPVTEPIHAVWFAVYDQNLQGPFPETIYAVPHYSQALDTHGGYTPEGPHPAAVFTPEDSNIYIFIQGSRPEYAGNFGLRLEISE